ncbi:maleylpyruvate isomerase N-terminal domain-containing protein [Mobilicoccus massiliensis]|uniref:maleylpyruvate isomerase N-terminal domain-containing protein n=1 Tax=Mobilicoccus massiliensis TaxID=1522310 RepID=UPI000693F335|nr:maleylpyruvate isomerase N-terminal domain-containing protein [Mobilicoccus massiliensis]
MASPDRQIVSSLLRQHRAATVELLQDLDDDRWATQSLCRAWTVRDVAAHLARQHAVRPTEMIPGWCGPVDA